MHDIKVCLIAPEFLPVWGGTGSYCIELAKNLAREVKLHVTTIEREKNGKAIYSKKDIEDFFDGNVDVHVLAKSPAKDTFFYNANMQLAVYRKMPELVKKYHFDILHSNFPAMADIMFKILRKISTPTVATVHTCIRMHREGTRNSRVRFQDIENSEKMTLLLLPYLLLCERLYLSKVKNLIFVSKYIKNLVNFHYGTIVRNSRMRVINIGTDINEFSPRRESEFEYFFPHLKDVGPILLFSGRLIALKGISVLVKAMKEVVSKNIEVHFVFAGPGSKDLLMKNLQKNAIPSNRYSVLDQIDRFHMPYLYAKSAMLILPSYIESFPLSILEAMSSESLVIASNVGGVPEIIDDGVDGVLVSAGKPDELAQKILYFLENEESRKNIGRKARKKIVENFTSARMTRDTIEVYERILNS